MLLLLLPHCYHIIIILLSNMILLLTFYRSRLSVNLKNYNSEGFISYDRCLLNEFVSDELSRIIKGIVLYKLLQYQRSEKGKNTASSHVRRNHVTIFKFFTSFSLSCDC
jgi:hypothetical protein